MLRCLVRAFSICLLLLLVLIGAGVAASWRCDLQARLPPPSAQPQERKTVTAGVKGYYRHEDDSYLSYPEWYIVWSYRSFHR